VTVLIQKNKKESNNQKNLKTHFKVFKDLKKKKEKNVGRLENFFLS
jgi:hypothetical protein